MDAMAGKRGEVGARVLWFGRKRLMGMGLRLGRWMPGDAPMSPMSGVGRSGRQGDRGRVLQRNWTHGRWRGFPRLAGSASGGT